MQIKCQNIFTATEARFIPYTPKQNQPPDFTFPPSKHSARVRLHHIRHPPKLNYILSVWHERYTRTLKRYGYQ